MRQNPHPSLLCAAVLLAVFVGESHGQARLERQRLMSAGPSPNAPSARLTGPARDEAPEELAPWTPLTSDIGEQRILKRIERYEPFSFSAAVAGYHTDNVALVGRGEEEDSFLVATLAAAWRPRLNARLYGEVSVIEQWYRYDEYTELDFQSLEPGAGLTYLSDWLGGMSFTARYAYTHLSDSSGKEFYTAHAVEAGVQKPFVLSRGVWFYLGLSTDLALATDPGLAGRNEYHLHSGLNAQLTRWLAVQIYSRTSAFDYTDYDRTDFNQIFGVNLNAQPWKNVTTSLFASVSINRSDVSVFDYEAFNPGVGVALNLRF